MIATPAPHLPVSPIESILVEGDWERVKYTRGYQQLSIGSVVSSTLNFIKTSIKPVEGLGLPPKNNVVILVRALISFQYLIVNGDVIGPHQISVCNSGPTGTIHVRPLHFTRTTPISPEHIAAWIRTYKYDSWETGNALLKYGFTTVYTAGFGAIGCL